MGVSEATGSELRSKRALLINGLRDVAKSSYIIMFLRSPGPHMVFHIFTFLSGLLVHIWFSTFLYYLMALLYDFYILAHSGSLS